MFRKEGRSEIVESLPGQGGSAKVTEEGGTLQTGICRLAWQGGEGWVLKAEGPKETTESSLKK